MERLLSGAPTTKAPRSPLRPNPDQNTRPSVPTVSPPIAQTIIGPQGGISFSPPCCPPHRHRFITRDGEPSFDK